MSCGSGDETHLFLANCFFIAWSKYVSWKSICENSGTRWKDCFRQGPIFLRPEEPHFFLIPYFTGKKRTDKRLTTFQSSSPAMSVDLRRCTVTRTHSKSPRSNVTNSSDSTSSSFASIIITTTVGSTIFVEENSDGVFWYENLRKVRVASDPMNDLYVERLVCHHKKKNTCLMHFR